MKYRIVQADRSLLPSVFELLCRGYRQERNSNPLLPDLAVPQRTRLRKLLEGAANGRGVAVTCGGEVVGYMAVSAQFDTRGQRAAIVHEFGHASVEQDRGLVCQYLYSALAEELVSQGVHLHIVGHFASDRELKDALFQLGFGALVAEELRDLSDVMNPAEVEIAQEECWGSIGGLAAEHARYYRDSPIFLSKDDSPAGIAKDLETHEQDGDRLLVYREGREPKAYFIVGKCSGADEGRLLQETNTAQVKSAYATPSARGKGIGSALLQHAVQWAREHGYDRIFVEHETANVYGGNFWRRHFRRYLCFSMRYVDGTL